MHILPATPGHYGILGATSVNDADVRFVGLATSGGLYKWSIADTVAIDSLPAEPAYILSAALGIYAILGATSVNDPVVLSARPLVIAAAKVRYGVTVRAVMFVVRRRPPVVAAKVPYMVTGRAARFVISGR
jgi:hypothetical protein